MVAPHTSLTAREVAHTRQHSTATATLTVAGMEGRRRRGVEKLLCELPEAPTTSEDDAIWFTRWRRAPDGTYECRETLRAPAEALVTFAEKLDAYAKSHGFVASVTPRSYDGAHV